jgi:hypothetical protein
MIRRLLGLAEAALLWMIYEVPRVLLAKLTPGLRQKSHIIETIIADETPRKARVAIIVLFPEGGIPDDIVSLARALTDADCSVVLMANRPLAPEALARLDGLFHTLHVRKNVGRDFGAYKDAVRSVINHEPLERLILLNDSCHYLSDKVPGLVGGLLGPDDMIGAHENFDPPYHLGSFALSFSAAVVRSRSFRDFWNSYLPVNTRRWSILKGEMGISRAVISAGFKPHVIYPADRLYQALMTATPSAVEDAVALLPRGAASLAALEVAMNANLAAEKAGSIEFTRTRLVEAIMRAVTQGSQVHTGAFLYSLFLGAPLIKKDLVFRQVFTADQLYLASLRVPLTREIVASTRARHSIPRGSLFTRRLRARGLV